MDTLAFFNIALSVVAALFGILTVVLGWMGNKLYEKLESLNTTLHHMENEVHTRISKLESRVLKLEVLSD